MSELMKHITGFHPLQVGFKLTTYVEGKIPDYSFHPLQVGFKLVVSQALDAGQIVFPSLTGRL